MGDGGPVTLYPVVATFDGEALHTAASGCSTYLELAAETEYAFPTRAVANMVCKCVFSAVSPDAAERRRGFALIQALPQSVRQRLDVYVDYPF